MVVSIVLAPIYAMAIWLFEATRNAQWSADLGAIRSGAAQSEVFAIGLKILAVFLAFAYFYVHAITGRQTVGQYIQGYRVGVDPDADSKPAFGLNLLLGFIGLCAWPVSLYLSIVRPDKAVWWNQRSHIKVVRVE